VPQRAKVILPIPFFFLICFLYQQIHTMILSGQARKLKIIVGENELVYQRPLYEAIVFAAKKYKLCGATVTKGVMSYGADSLAHNAKVFSLAEHAPMIIELVDVSERIEDFAQIVSKLMDKANSGGIIFLEDVVVVKYARPVVVVEPSHNHTSKK
jgi:PII-like signaling protein